MRQTIKAYIHKGEKYYVAECLELAVVTQGITLDETVANLKEAVSLHLEDENPEDFDLVPNPTLLITMELEPVGVS
ncbi:MAG: type II toxin-antitoxin system HicB family antitoxin [Dehalococcoidales bacterium]|nr:type II toxin-antitoxin system HicB family antitoxin [Dehalococcoidales bacterium]